VNLLLRVLGGIVATGLGAALALYEAFLTPLYWHGTRLPLALVIAVVGNAGVAWFTRETTGRVSAVLLPAGVWVVLMVIAAGRTTEGDFVLTNNWVGLSTMFGGALAFAIPAYLFVLSGARPRPPTLGSGSIT
jgi:hypothetical protein